MDGPAGRTFHRFDRASAVIPLTRLDLLHPWGLPRSPRIAYRGTMFNRRHPTSPLASASEQLQCLVGVRATVAGPEYRAAGWHGLLVSSWPVGPRTSTGRQAASATRPPMWGEVWKQMRRRERQCRRSSEALQAGPQSRRLLPRYTVRTLLCITLVCALVLSSWRVLITRYQRQQAIVNDMAAYGLHVTEYSDQAPAWLRRVAGPDRLGFLREVTSVGDSHLSDVCDDDLALRLVGQLPSLQTLHLGWMAVTDRAMGHLSGLCRLRRLELLSARMTDDSLVYLKPLRRLEVLLICATSDIWTLATLK